MGGTGDPLPPQTYIDAVNTLFIQPNHPGAMPQLLPTPEEGYPLTGVKSMVLTRSVNEGMAILNNAIMQQLATPGVSTVTVFGTSQSVVMSSLLMQQYAAMSSGDPLPSQLNFVLIGDEMNPNGGIFARFPV
ncbi:putative PPE family protein PPE42 [Mycobacterium attenuatum]|nr:putative PPE family protein PPE42 [Mycobacterium attenuatum]